jgi:hypothetical protein
MTKNMLKITTINYDYLRFWKEEQVTWEEFVMQGSLRKEKHYGEQS